MTTNFLNTITSAIENRDEELKKRKENAKLILKDLIICIENCQSRFGGRSELATEDDIRIVNLCEKWEKVLSHGLRTNLSNYTLQNFVTAGLNFNFNIINVGNSLWSYSCLHLTKHEKERFKILTNINTPLGYFRSFLRAALNERSLERENDKLKEQLRNYMSAVEMGKAMKTSNGQDEEVTQYERKLVQVAEMHAELMEFNQHLQRRLQDLESTGLEILDCPESNVKVYIPSAFLVGKKTHSYHVYQIFLKVGQEEWNVYHRYAKFYEMHTQLKKCHPDIANYNFPPKKTLRKRDARVVEQRRIALQAYLRHVLLVLPELRECTSRSQLITLLPFFGTSSTAKENGVNIFTSQHSNDSASTYDPI
ncbi:sorting nexin-29-like isoform X2 [Pieris brassicae]|uniref:sorting nexin-29-like isoform X2 n=1 Tax=Pieris brassicae TaxID=7116 RepID=UPI001E65EFD9|nr:sorting nexin-29-like isoform X2 [Pieris brassicae]